MKKSLTNKSGEVRELTKATIKRMKPIQEVLPELTPVLLKRKRGERGAQKNPKKILVSSRFSPEVVEYFKNTGEGWQTRMDLVLKIFIKEHPRYPKKIEQQQTAKPTKHRRHAV